MNGRFFCVSRTKSRYWIKSVFCLDVMFSSGDGNSDSWCLGVVNFFLATNHAGVLYSQRERCSGTENYNIQCHLSRSSFAILVRLVVGFGFTSYIHLFFLVHVPYPTTKW
eukprot:GHVP01062996.1.p1 GENE.GHVP01062996.1~~GHVP01062996.1.p1  ORF type:complete len:110 (-),score=1.54 GHVP01062996.1:58-387(-)